MLNEAQEEREVPGVLCMAIKEWPSASAHSPFQVGLHPGNDPYHLQFDLRADIARHYSKGKKEIHGLLEPSFDILYSDVRKILGYDRPLEEEQFRFIIGRPKPNEILPKPTD